MRINLLSAQFVTPIKFKLYTGLGMNRWFQDMNRLYLSLYAENVYIENVSVVKTTERK